MTESQLIYTGWQNTNKPLPYETKQGVKNIEHVNELIHRIGADCPTPVSGVTTDTILESCCCDFNIPCNLLDNLI